MTDPMWRPPVRDGGPAVACVGETMVSFIPSDGTALDATARVGLDIAGAESNVAMYLADHGLDARWVSRLGDDAFGRRVLHRVRTAGVDVSGVVTDPVRPTGLLFKDPAENGTTRVSYYRQGSAASAMGPYVLDEEVMRTADVWHFTGITPALSMTCRDLVEAAIGGDGPTVSFDVNLRPAVWSEAPGGLLRRLAQAADIVFVGLDEAQALWGDELREPSDVRALLSLPRVVVVKDGAKAATAFFGESCTCVPALAVHVVELVGAGDAFAAGFLAGLLRGESPERCLRLGHLTAASALSVVGDHGPLLDEAEAQYLLGASTGVWSAGHAGRVDSQPADLRVTPHAAVGAGGRVRCRSGPVAAASSAWPGRLGSGRRR
jgi:2-dehydro-3-deoxygluconokinase